MRQRDFCLKQGQAGSPCLGRIERRVVSQVAAVFEQSERWGLAVCLKGKLDRRRKIVKLVGIMIIAKNRNALDLVEGSIDGHHGFLVYLKGVTFMISRSAVETGSKVCSVPSF